VKRRILFLCTGNSIRSQMAEGLATAFHGEEVEAVSAGSRPAGIVHPLAVAAMAEKGIDISGAQSKGADPFLDREFDIVVTVCDSAAADCPMWPGARRIEHWPIPDPISGAGDAMPRFRAVRDDLERRIDALLLS
jgi:arsenate reductase (thioredoxin)